MLRWPCLLAVLTQPARSALLLTALRVRGGAESAVDRTAWQGPFKFPDGSSYVGETKDGRICGEGEWRSAAGDVYCGEFVDDVFHGPGKYTDANGNILSGTFRHGAMDGAGTYLYADGRADVSAYEGGAEVGEGVRWSPDRTQAWRLQKGQLDGRGETFDVESDQISLADAEEIAASLGLRMPPSIYEVPEEKMASMMKRIREGSTEEEDEEQLEVSDIDARLRGTSLDGGSTGYLVAHSSAPLVPPQVCKGIIEECEARAVRLGGWSTKRHTNYPTTDVAVQRLPNTLEYFRTKLLPEIAWPFLAKAFGFVLPSPEGEEELAGALRAAEAFIVKYNASAGQKELKPHRDGSVFSFNVALNDLDEYEGGGTEFEALDGKAIRSPRGHLLAHSSALMHGGHTLASGVRYILVCFVTVDAEHSEWGKRFREHVASGECVA